MEDAPHNLVADVMLGGVVLLGAALMVLAGAAWGVYSLRGKGAGDPTLVTAGNFWRAAVLALALSAVMQASTVLDASWDTEGLAYAVASGAVAAARQPRASVTLWQKMAAANKGGGPAFLSTHPSGPNRIKELQANVPKVMGLYERARRG